LTADVLAASPEEENPLVIPSLRLAAARRFAPHSTTISEAELRRKAKKLRNKFVNRKIIRDCSKNAKKMGDKAQTLG